MFFLPSKFNLHQIGFFLTLILLTLSFGGRNPIGLTLYYLWTLFQIVRTEKEFELYKTKLDRPLLAFLLAASLSALYSIFSNRTGFIYLTTLLCHAANFYIFFSNKEDRFNFTTLNFIKALTICFAFVILIFQFTETDIKAIFPNENLLSAFLNCGLFISMAHLRDSEKNLISKFLPISILTLAQISLASRGGTIALLLTLIIFLSLDWRAAVRSIEILLGILLLTFILWPDHFKNISDSFFSNALGYSRIHIWKGAFQAYLARPFLGWGLGNFGAAYLRHRLPIEAELGRYEKTTSFAHNEFLDVAVQMGSVGLVLYLWAIATILYYVTISLKKKREDWRVVGSALSIFALIFHSLFDFVFHLPLLALLLFTFTALIIGDKGAKFRPGFLTSIKKGAIPAMACTSIGLFALLLMHLGHPLWAHRLNPFYHAPIEKMVEITKHEERIRWLNIGLRLLKSRDDLYEKLAREEMFRGHFDAAITALKEAIKINPKFPYHYSELAEIYLAQGNTPLAKEYLIKAIEIEPLYSQAHYQLGILSIQEGKSAQAKRYFENILKIETVKIKSDSPYVKRLFDFDVNLAKKILRELPNG